AGQAEPMAGEGFGELLPPAQVTQWSKVDAGGAGRSDLVEDLRTLRDIGQDPDRQLERAIAHRSVGDDDRALAHERLRAGASAGSEGRSRGRPLRWTRTMASQRAMSRSESRPDVTGSRPDVRQSWKWMSSSLKLSRYEVISSVREERCELSSPSSETSSVGALRRKGDGNFKVSRRSGE